MIYRCLYCELNQAFSFERGPSFQRSDWADRCMIKMIVRSVGCEKQGQLRSGQDPGIAILAFPSLLRKQEAFVLPPLFSPSFLLSLLYRF